MSSIHSPASVFTEQLAHDSRLLSRARLKGFPDNCPSAEGIPASSKAFLYSMPRPAWAGFSASLARAADVAESDITVLRNSFGAASTCPLATSALSKLEMIPASLEAQRAIASSLTDMRRHLFLRGHNENYSLLLNTEDGCISQHYVLDDELQLSLKEQETHPDMAAALLAVIDRNGVQSLAPSSTLMLLPVAAHAEVVFAEANAIRNGSPGPARLALVGDTPEAMTDAFFSQMIAKAATLDGGPVRLEAIAAYIEHESMSLVKRFGVSQRRPFVLADALLGSLEKSKQPLPVAPPAPSQATTKWIDLSEVNVYLGEQRLASGQTRMVLLDMDGMGDPAKLAAIGFDPMPGVPSAMRGIYVRQRVAEQLSARALGAALGVPKVPVVQVTAAQITETFKRKANERYQANMGAMLATALPLGVNYSGYDVFESPEGRFVRNGDGRVSFEVSEGGKRLGRAAFMRADSGLDLRLVADGIMHMIRRGQRLKSADVHRLASVAFADHLPESESLDERAKASPEQVHELQEAIEAAAYRGFQADTPTLTEDSFQEAKAIYYALPAAQSRSATTLTLQQYSTPLPMSLVAQRLVFGADVTDGKVLLEPTAGNAGLLTAVPSGIEIDAMELDGSRLAAIKELPRAIQARQGDAAETNFKAAFNRTEGYDYTLVNPPFGGMPEPKVFGPMPRVSKYDHYIPLASLAARKDQGRSVFIIGADSPRSDGTLSASSQHLMNYLCHHYEVEGAVELDGRLYSRQGAAFNVRMIVVGDRREVPDPTIEAPTKLSILDDYDALWQWSGDLVANYGHLKRAAVVLEAGAIAAATDVSVDVADEFSADPAFGGDELALTLLDESPAEVVALVQLSALRELAANKGLSADDYALIEAQTNASSESLIEVAERMSKLLGEKQGTVLDEPLIGNEEANELLDNALTRAEDQGNDAQDAVILPALGHLNVDAPWMLTRQQWESEWDGIRADPTTTASQARAEWLSYGVAQWVRDRLALHEVGDITLGDDDLQSLQEQLAAPVTHRDVIDKALGAELPVPLHVRSDYAEFRAVHVRQSNDYQVPYQAQSQVGVSEVMVPINMASSVYSALRDLVNEHGDIDEFVARELHYPKETLGEFFSPEQVDALGLSIRALRQGRGMINADMTGVGKGRWVAGMLRYARLNDMVPVFSTIKPELFTDIFRDIKDIGSMDLFKSVFIVNDNVKVMKYGTADEVLFPATKKADRVRAMESGVLPEGTDIVLTTYSQLQREASKNAKVRLTVDACKDSMLLMDEAHVASGESNIGVAMSECVANANGVMYASATPLKGVKNFGIYSKIFPRSVDLKNLPETLEAGGESLMEAINTAMAADGVFIRREHDLSQLTFNTVFPSTERADRNIELANSLSRILSRMAYLSGDVSEQVLKLNKEYEKDWSEVPEADRRGQRLQATSMNFGSRLYSVCRQFLLSAKIDAAVEQAMTALAEGRKPVLACENTGESITREVIMRRMGLTEVNEEIEQLELKGEGASVDERTRLLELQEHVNIKLKNIALDSPPQFRELLEVMLDRATRIKVQGSYGEVRYEQPESAEFALFSEETREMIREFPDLSLVPLDEINNAFRARGLKAAEVSGRSMSLEQNAYSGKLDVVFRPKLDAVEQVAGFQNGTYDCISITRSGSTGISLHATNRFKDSDYRQREFIVLQKASNIAEFLQWLGRVNRKDQVVPPIISTLESGLPAEARLTMMHNNKLRRLSANTSSNRDNANIEGEEFDFLNSIGDAVARDWLAENPDVATLLDVKMLSEEEEQQRDCYYINRLMGRIYYAGDVERQERIMQVLSDRFLERLTMLKQQGINPFEIEVFDWRARVTHEECLQSTSLHASSSVFDEPVKLVKLAYDVEIHPMRPEDIDARVEANLERFNTLSFVENGRPEGWKAMIRARIQEEILGSLPVKEREGLKDDPSGVYRLLDEAKDDLYRGARQIRDKGRWLISNLDALTPGRIMPFSDQDAVTTNAVILNVRFPDEGREFLLGQYSLDIIIPGDERPRSLPLSALYAQETTLSDLRSTWWPVSKTDSWSTAGRLRREIEACPTGHVTRERHVLMGNIFRACEMASKQHMGRPVLYTDEAGNRCRAVSLRADVTPEMVKSMPIPMSARDVALYASLHIEKHGRPRRWGSDDSTELRIYNKPSTGGTVKDGLYVLSLATYGYSFVVPGAKSITGSLAADGGIFDNGKGVSHGLGLSLTGNKTQMSCAVPDDMVDKFLSRLESGRHVEKFYIPNPDTEIMDQIRAIYQKEAARAARRLKREQAVAEAEAEVGDHPALA